MAVGISNCQHWVSLYLTITPEPADDLELLEMDVMKNKIFLTYIATDQKSFNPGHDSRSWEINIFLGFRKTYDKTCDDKL